MKRILEIVRFYDSYSLRERWRPVDDIIEDVTPMICISVGWVIKETDTHLCLCPNFDNDDSEEVVQNGHSPFVIPKCSIVTRKVIDNETD